MTNRKQLFWATTALMSGLLMAGAASAQSTGTEATEVSDVVVTGQRGPRNITVEYDAEPALLLGYHKPAYPNPDDLKFSVLHTLLAHGRSSILYRELVMKQQRPAMPLH